MTAETALPMTDLTPQVREVARLRREHTAIGALLEDRTRVFVEAHADDIAHRQALGKQLAEAEADLRRAAEVLFLQSGEKLPAPGVVVKEKTVFEYDEAEALPGRSAPRWPSSRRRWTGRRSKRSPRPPRSTS